MAPFIWRPPGGEGGTGGPLAAVVRFWSRTYAADYVGFVALLLAYLFIQFFVEPFHRLFAISDLRIAFPHAATERVPLVMNFVYALFIPLGLIALHLFASGASRHKHNVAYLGFAIAMILTPVLTDTVKNAVGRPRPDLLARCKPLAGTAKDVLVSIAVCTETSHHLLHDGWRSFPSGHSSFAFTGLGYLSLFWAGQLRVFSTGEGTKSEKLVRGDLGRSLLCLGPLLGAAMIAISRCEDYRHDVYDVCVGSLLGWSIAFWSYRRYWPRLTCSSCDEPYAEPAQEESAARYGRLQDEESASGEMGHNLA